MSIERHNMYEEDVGAYVLHALTEVEKQRFELHLAECPLCQDEVARLRPAADALPRSVMPVAPPAHLKASLMASVEADVREREQAEGGAVKRGRRPLTRLRRHRERGGGSWASGRPAMAWVAASVILLVGIISGAGGFLALTEATKDPEPGSRTLSAVVDKTRLPQGSGSLVVPENQDGAVLRVQGLPDLEPSSVYQVWVKRRGEVISQSLFVVGEDGQGAAGVADDLEGAEAVLVTRENAGGAKAPSEEPVLRVAL